MGFRLEIQHLEVRKRRLELELDFLELAYVLCLFLEDQYLGLHFRVFYTANNEAHGP